MEHVDSSAKKTSTKRVILIAALGVLLALLVVAGTFEAWRQTKISSERSALVELSVHVDREVLKEKTAPDYYNAKAKGRNGWQQFNALAKSVSESSPERSELLDALQDWGASEDDGEPARPVEAAAAAVWLAATRELAQTAGEIAACDIIARTYSASAKWGDAAIAVLPHVRVFKLLGARVRLLAQVNRKEDAAREAVVLAKLALLQRDPGSLIEALVFIGTQNPALRTLSETEGVPAGDLRSLLTLWPERRMMFERAVEGELVWMRWLMDTEPSVNGGDGLFHWAPSASDELGRPMGPLVSINMRSALKTYMQYLLACLKEVRAGANLASGIPPPPEEQFVFTTNPFTVDMLERGRQFEISFAELDWRKGAVEVRLLQSDAPLEQQLQKLREYAAANKLLISFEGKDCIVRLDPAGYAGIDVFAIAGMSEGIRIKPLK